MTSSESIRALVFVALALIGCVIRTYIRTASGDKEQDHSSTEKDAFFSYSEGGNIQARSATSSGQVSQLVSVRHEQPPRFPDAVDTTESSVKPVTSDDDFGEAYEDWAAMRLARGGCPDETETSFDNVFLRKSLANLDSFGISGASTPSVWTAHFPASQLRPY